MNSTPIEWTRTYKPDGTWEPGFTSNPIRAYNINAESGHHCEKVSPGCANCYASKLQPRFKFPEFVGSEAQRAVETYLDQAELQRLLKRRKPCKVFLGDMTDIFGEWVLWEWLDQICAVAVLNLDMILQLLTKRAENMREYFSHPDWWERVYQQATRMMLPNDIRQVSWDHPPRPLPNLWLGVSVESPDYLWRLDHLRETPAAIRFASFEPLLADLGDISKHLESLDWAIVGGESGPNARPMHPDWARSVRDQCNAAQVPFFFKQWGTWQPVDPTDDDATIRRLDKSGSVLWEDHHHPAMVRVGKKSAGALLDGKEFRGFPEVASP